MSNFCIRIDAICPQECILSLVTDKLRASGLGCVECPQPNNLHYHFMIITPENERNCRKIIQRFIKPFVPSGGNGVYSLSTKLGNESYICKGYLAAKKYPGTRGKKSKYYNLETQSSPQIIFNTEGYTDEELQGFHDDFWDWQKKIQEEEEKPLFRESVDAWWAQNKYKIKSVVYYNNLPSREKEQRWVISKMCEGVGDELASFFKLSDQLFDFGIIRKYVCKLVIDDIVPSKYLMRAMQGDRDFFGNM